jgi:phage baseplate assembly protein gpV
MNDFDHMMRKIMSRFDYYERKIEDLERRVSNIAQEGVIQSINADDGTATVLANGLPGPPSPWLTRAGSRREWDPPAVGERVVTLNPSGEPGMGLILPGGFTDKYKAPHNKAGEYRSAVSDEVYREETKDRHRLKNAESRAVVTPSYAKLRNGGNYIIVTAQGVFCSRVPVVGPDPEPDV